MKVFHCTHCQHLVFFENVQCIKCGHPLAYIPTTGEIAALESVDNGLQASHWHPIHARNDNYSYRLCRNYTEEHICNWAVPAEDEHDYCISCRLTRKIPDLGVPAHRELWGRLETAKRRLMYSLLELKLPLVGKSEDPEAGLAFEFLADAGPGAPPVLTGHSNGVIVVNVAEADDAERERRKLQLHEPYRTILGHFRHEIGHYYWDRLIEGTDWIDPFRQTFGDEREDYQQCLNRHYESGPPPDWQAKFVSAYASMHAWEDWAETWAHYLHIHDTLETAFACGLSLQPRRSDEPAIRPKAGVAATSQPFEQMIQTWYPLTYVLNNLNRGLGLADSYPFVLSAPAVEKLRFVHRVIAEPRRNGVIAEQKQQGPGVVSSAPRRKLPVHGIDAK